MSFRLIVHILTVIGCCVWTSADEGSNICFKAEDYFWKHLGTKTPYRYVANYNDSQVVYGDCMPKKIWMVVRHGTRYPGVKFINELKTTVAKLQQSIVTSVEEKNSFLCSSHGENISQWTSNVNLEDNKQLTHEGEDEMIELAERFQNRFPSLLGQEYSNSSFKFKHTATERTKQSKYYFTVGLFGKRVANNVWSPEPLYKDPILRFYKLCPKWLKEIHKNPTAATEYEAFKTSKIVKKLIKNLSFRLGFTKNLSFYELELMYMTCSYESAWNRKAPSPWCFLFEEEDMKIMEFARDLKHYWHDGYGNNINFEQACPMLQDMLNYLSSDEGPSSMVYFTHSGTLLKFLSHLGLYYDSVKMSEESYNHPRLWRVGYMDAFGSNLAFITFQCGDELKVLTLHQERPIHLPGCPKEGLCSLKKLLKTYKQSFRFCNFDEMCKL